MSNTTNKSIEEDTDTGVSPVIGVILMVAITVILSAVIGVFVLSIGDVGETASAGVSVDEDPEDGVVVRLTDSGNTDEIIVEKNGSEESRLTNVGESTTVAVSSGDTVSVIGVTEDGDQSVIQNYTATQDLGSAVPANVSGTASYNPPAEGVTVTALDDSGSVVGQDTTDAHGNFSVPQTGNYEVNGYAVTTTVSSGTDVELDTSDVTKNGDSIAKVLMEGDGSKSNPYKIDNASDLQAIRTDDDEQYILTKDIDASHTSSWNSSSGFETIKYLNGVLNGQGYTVSNITFKNTSTGVIDINNGNINNIGITNSNIISTETYVGGLVGSNNGKIINSYVDGSVEGNRYVGGLVGSNNGKIINSYSLADVTATDSNAYAGGLVANNSQGSVEQSYSVGKVTAANPGGLIGIDTGDTPTKNSYWDSESSGISSSSGGTGLTTSEMQGSGASSNMNGFDFSNDYTISSGSYPSLSSYSYSSEYSVNPANININSPTSVSTYDFEDGTISVTYDTNTNETTVTFDVELDISTEDGSDIKEVKIDIDQESFSNTADITSETFTINSSNYITSKTITGKASPVDGPQNIITSIYVEDSNGNYKEVTFTTRI